MKRSNLKSIKLENIVSPIINDEYKNRICESAYLGKRGYTIPKLSLTAEDLAFLKKDLFLKPELPGAINYGAQDDQSNAFPVYRENDKKIYIPRFYGVERYGLPTKSKIEPGLDINIQFVKELRDYQNQIVDTYLNTVRGVNPSGGILQMYTGAGKTICAIKIAASLGKKTMILVHKEFLLNQWVERIQEFTPNARIGKIQGKILDIENKDIVIAMIQTMYNRDFPKEVYSQFGLTIIDEVHRIGSEEFSKTLLKTITPYMLGISATVERKDKLTKLLYMFIGPIIFSTERKKDDIVTVCGLEYKTTDKEFNEEELDYRGNIKYSTMMSKICDYRPRTIFILKVIEDLVKENPGKQIIVLAHYRNLLKEFYDSIENKKFASVGYYVGGMKQKELKESETKTVVLASYAMAAEGLDIPSLSILVLATPKTDVVQSVGRILRKKHDNPMIIDIIDSHNVFNNQWTKRRRYYKNCNYKIQYNNSETYDNKFIGGNWKKIYEPKLNFVHMCEGSDASHIRPSTKNDSDQVQNEHNSRGLVLDASTILSEEIEESSEEDKDEQINSTWKQRGSIGNFGNKCLIDVSIFTS